MMIYSKEYDLYFNDDGDLDDWREERAFDGHPVELKDMKLVICKEVYFHETFDIGGIAGDSYFEKFEDASIPDKAVAELEELFKAWSIKHDLHWYEPTNKPYDFTEPT